MDGKRIRRMPLPLCLDNPLHMKALKIIEAIPKGKRTEFICKKITAKEDEISPALRKAMYEAVMQALREHGAISVQQPAAASEEQEPPQDTGEARTARNNFLGFLATLRGDEDDEDE